MVETRKHVPLPGFSSLEIPTVYAVYSVKKVLLNILEACTKVGHETRQTIILYFVSVCSYILLSGAELRVPLVRPWVVGRVRSFYSHALRTG